MPEVSRVPGGIRTPSADQQAAASRFKTWFPASRFPITIGTGELQVHVWEWYPDRYRGNPACCRQATEPEGLVPIAIGVQTSATLQLCRTPFVEEGGVEPPLMAFQTNALPPELFFR